MKFFLTFFGLFFSVFLHARIEVKWPIVKVYVENADIPSLEVKMLSHLRKGKLDFGLATDQTEVLKTLL